MRPGIDRRSFLTASPLLPVVAGASSSLALEGGKPVRKTPLRAGYFGTAFYGDSESQQLAEVVKARQPFRWYGPGSRPPGKVAAFERQFAARMQTRYALALTSGSAALQVAMAALQIGPGDEVILPAWTWYSCYNAVVLAGALPVFAEVDASLNLDPADVESKITSRTKAIIAVHTLGSPCDMHRIIAVAQPRRIRIVEDCAQSLGARYKGQPVGSLGDIGIYSFQINKTITSGEGGALVTNDPVLFERASRFHDLGNLRALHAASIGETRLDGFAGSQFRMSEFTGSVLIAQLSRLHTIVAAVQALSRRVREQVQTVPAIRFRPQADVEGELGSHVFLTFATQGQRNRFVAAMAAENVPAHAPSGSVILPIQPHIERKLTVHPGWPSFTTGRGLSIRYGVSCCPQTIAFLERTAGVALDPTFTSADTDDIVAAIRKVYPNTAIT
jgi:8-amino-3,8-dideoxy-alpha-D-manno-octulosonate transaminase